MRKNGFTIVELLIVIVIIAILAAITVVAYNGIAAMAVQASLKADLNKGAKVIETTKINTGVDKYAADASGLSLKASEGNAYQYTYSHSNNTYCLTATTPKSDTGFHIDNTGVLSPNTCPGHSSKGLNDPLVKPAWTAAQVNTLLTTPVSTTIAGKPFAVSASLSAGSSTSTHIDGNNSFGYTIDGVANATTPTPDAQLASDRTLTVQTTFTANSFQSLNLYVSDAENTSFTVTARNASSTVLPVADWSVTSQEYNGTKPASHSNPYTKNATNIQFSGILGQDDDVTVVSLDPETLKTATSVSVVFQTTSSTDWFQWAFMGRAK